MTSIVRIRNFKCFADISVEIASLNILCGRNGAGKSSFTQALLLHRAALKAAVAGLESVPLNGPHGLALGTALDVIHRGPEASMSTSMMSIGADIGRARLDFDFNLDEVSEDSNSLVINDRSRTLPIEDSPWSFVYLSAERTGPRATQDRLSNLPLAALALGEYGENSAEVLQRLERKFVRSGLVRSDGPGRPNRRLSRNLEAWLGTLFGPIQVRADQNGRYAPPSLLVRSQRVASDWILATNHGFGVTYSLPIILAGLLLTDGGVLIVDGPEAHLHPAAQTAMAIFLTKVAASGCTVIVETHSDHIVDGVRLAVAQDESNSLGAECRFLNFDKDPRGSIYIETIKVDRRGVLSSWPHGFFDEQTRTLRALASAKSR